MARNGKIARLPYLVRERINRALHDGDDADTILLWLNELAEVSSKITPQNLSAWRNGGYAEWVADQNEVEKIKKITEYCSRIAGVSDPSMSDGLKAIAAGKILFHLQNISNNPDDTSIAVDLAKAACSINKADQEQRRLSLSEIKIKQSQAQLDLARSKFERETCDLFLKWYNDRRAAEIAASEVNHDIKMAELSKLIFGVNPNVK
jgi:hypothetical protein